MENLYYKFLSEFEKTGLSSKKSISPFMEKNFDKPKSEDPEAWRLENENARAFLWDVRCTSHFDFNENEDYDIQPGRWYDIVDINARITIAGLAYLDAHKTNTRITQNSSLQTFAIALTVILTAITLIITLRNSTSDKQVDNLKTHIQKQTQQLHTLQIELSQTTNELFLSKETKKNLQKKP